VGVLRHVATIAGKDLRVELRSGEILLTMIFFAVMVVLMFSFAFLREVSEPGPGQSGVVAVADVTPGFLFIAVLFSGTLGLSRAFDRERESDTMRGLLLAPVPRSAIFLGKAVGMTAFMAIVQLAVVPLVWFFFDAPVFERPGVLALILALATFGFAVVGSLFAAMLLRARARDVLLPVVLYPILMPLLIAGVKALSGLFLDDLDWFWVKFLVFYDAAFAVIALWVFESLVIE
jgi:heme exporter protein CcmB